MKQRRLIVLAVLAIGLAGLALFWTRTSFEHKSDQPAPVTLTTRQDAPRILIATSQGDITVALDDRHAPQTVTNFLDYVRDNAYAETIFHRVIDGFMIQGGGYDRHYAEQPTHPPVQNEARNGLKNRRGTIAMARTSDPHSATRQFFINVVDNDFLDHRDTSVRGWGYAVFGQVVTGMDVVDKISHMPTGPGGPFSGDVPKDMVIIRNISLIETP